MIVVNSDFEALYGITEREYYTRQYLTFEATADNSGVDIYIPYEVLDGDGVTSISYSTDEGDTWTTISNEDQAEGIRLELDADEGDKIMLKGDALNYAVDDHPSNIYLRGEMKVYGNIMSLLWEDDLTNDEMTEEDVFAGLFADNDVAVADFSNMILPATELTIGCYSGMFNCFTNLIAAPELLATSLNDSCYAFMFTKCPNLAAVTMTATDVTPTDCLDNWLNGVAETGTFTKAEEAELPSGASGIPEGWTVQDYE